MASSLEDELERFRSEWLQETKNRNQQHPLPNASTSAPPPKSPVIADQPRQLSSSPPHRSLLTGLETELRRLNVHEQPESVEPKTALEHYEVAVQSERRGELNDALVYYRKAFKLDQNIDRLYHRTTLASQNRMSEEPPSERPQGGAGFEFQRTVQTTADYSANLERRTIEGTSVESQDEDMTHPSSTRFLLNSLLNSFGENPWIRPTPGMEGDRTPPPPKLTPEEAEHQLTFIQDDEELPSYFAMLPREVLFHILHYLSLSSVIPPPVVKHVETTAPGPGSKNKAKQRRTPKEEMKRLEVEMGVGVDEKREAWETDVEALERFAKTCRAARILTLDKAIWRNLCLRTYVAPHQISREETPEQIMAEQHGGDWRRCYIEHPRIRLDGVFIAVVTYLRRGDNHSALYSPSHIVTFYRYLRFYPTGLVISFLTVEPPTKVVKDLNATLRAKGATFGRWRLRTDHVECWGLEDPAVNEASRKYSFRMQCRLKSTARGRMNKLEMLSLATENRATGELIDVPIRPVKPFYFSKVASYAAEALE